MEPCPICKKDADINQTTTSDRTEINCKRCGKYVLSETLKSTLNANMKNTYPKLSAVVRESFENGEVKYLDSYTYEELNRKGEGYRLTERVKKFLNYLSTKTTKFGQQITIDVYRDWPLAYCYDDQEFTQFLIELNKQELISAPNISGTVVSDQYGKSHKIPVKLTYKTWIQLYESSEGINSRKVFLAYDFKSDEIERVIKVTRECLSELQLEPIDLKTNFPSHDQKISDKIVAEIRAAKFVIADCSVRNVNVFFEAGFSMGLSRPVIFICNKKKLKSLPFDTNHYLHIDWDISNLDDFKQKLKERLIAYKLVKDIGSE